MTTPASSHYATNGHAEKMRLEKARELATWCWAHGVDGAALAGMSDEARRRVARSAGVNQPSTWNTWAVTVGLLEKAAERPDMADRFGSDGTPEWVGTTENDPAKNISSASPKTTADAAGGPGAALGGSPEPGGIPALVSDHGELTAYGERLEAAVAAHPAGKQRPATGDVTLPRGWDVLAAANVELGHGRVCSVKRCGTPAIAAMLTQFRCAVHPPQPGEWGHRLDWTPKATGACAPNRCYCGACPSYRLAAVPSVPTPRDDKKGGRR